MEKEIRKLSDIVGFTLLKMTDRQILIEKDGTYFILDFSEEKGRDDLSGMAYTEVRSYFYPDTADFTYCEAVKEMKITKVEYHYCSGTRDSQSVIIRFFFGDYCLGRIEAEAGDCIGEKHGTKLCVVCDRLHFREVLAEW